MDEHKESHASRPERSPFEPALTQQLAEAAMQLLGSETADDVWEVAGTFLAAVCPDAVIIINEPTPEMDGLVTRRVIGLESSFVAKAADLFGVQLVGGEWPLAPEYRYEVLSGELTQLPGGVVELAAREIPRAAAEAGAVLFGRHDVYTVGIADGHSALGSIRILTRAAKAGTSAPEIPVRIIESFARHCYSALSRLMREREARASQLLLRSSLESQRGTILFSIDTEYRYLYFNEAHADAMRYSYGREVQLGDNILDNITSEEDRVAAKENYDRALAGESHSNIRKFGDIASAYFESYFNPITDDDGNIIGATGMARDVTERIEADEQRRESEERFSALFMGAPLGYQSLDEDGRFIEVNPAWLETLGYEREEVLGAWFGDFLAPEYVDAFRERFPLFKKRGAIHSEFQMMHKDGTRHFIAFDGRIGHNPDGSFKQTHCILADITERKRSEDALRESEERYRASVETAMDGFWLSSIDGRILEVNQAYCQMSGYTEDELVGMPVSELEVGESAEMIAEHNQRIMRDGRDRFESRHRRKDGTLFDAEISVSYQDVGGGQFSGFIRDITERKQAEDALRRWNADLEERVQERTEELTCANEELLETNKQLDEATRAKSDFLASMSHELRTPLNSIIGFSDLLGRGLVGELEPEQSKQVGMINESGKRLLVLVDDILDLSKIESGQTIASFEECEIEPLIGAVMDMIRPLAEAKHIDLEYACDTDVESFVSDPRFVSQILTNLLGNALKFTDEGAVTLRVSTDLAAMTFAVIDTGRGIAAEDLPRIMERFYQAGPASQTKSEGAGLGLAISSRLAEMLGATLEVASVLGEGSTFTLRIPLGDGHGHLATCSMTMPGSEVLVPEEHP